MATKDWLTLSVSTLAFMIALYGIIERRQQYRKATRIRLNEIIDELNALALEQANPLLDDDAHIQSGWHAQANARREVLCSMAVSMVDQVGAITPGEYRALAHSLRRVGDLDESAKFWRKAISASPAGTPYKCFSHRGYGDLLAWAGDYAGSDAQFRLALKSVAGGSDWKLNHQVETLTSWTITSRAVGRTAEFLSDLDERAEGILKNVASPVQRDRSTRIREVRLGGQQDNAHAVDLVKDDPGRWLERGNSPGDSRKKIAFGARMISAMRRR